MLCCAVLCCVVLHCESLVVAWEPFLAEQTTTFTNVTTVLCSICYLVIYMFCFLFLWQVDVANKYIDYHTSQFGFSKPNTEFKMGEIENLGKAGIRDSSVDIIV